MSTHTVIESERTSWTALAVLMMLVMGGSFGCRDQQTGSSASLEGPLAFDVAERDTCGESASILRSFRDGVPCRIGLVSNAESNSLAVADMQLVAGDDRLPLPRVFDYDPATPGVNHMEVGGQPVDVAASPAGDAAYVVNAADADLSVVDLWQLAPLDARLQPEGQPTGVTTFDAGSGPSDRPTLAVSTRGPDTLWFHPGVTCDPDTGCQGTDADGSSRPAPGTITDMSVAPGGDRLYTVYREHGWASIWALPTDESLQDRGLQCRDGAQSAPCEVDRIGLRWGCSDGLDNDGDGLVDQEDPQCYGPKGAESPDGVGRPETTVCTDGMDNDGDGLTDREDPDCQLPGGTSESEPTVPDAPDPACDDGVDNDDDGLTDANDPDCYGNAGRTERSPNLGGFDSVSAGPMGEFLYASARGDDEVMIVDAQTMDLVDAGRVEQPPNSVPDDAVGVAVGSQPGDLDAAVRRQVVWTDSDDPSHGIVRYLYGAWAASADGRTWFVNTAEAYCEVTEPNRDELLSRSEFDFGSQAFRDSAESDCVTVPELPLEIDRSTDACSAVDACEQCQRMEGEAFSQMCLSACEDLQSNRQACQTQGRRLDPSANTRLAINPRASLRDTDGSAARLTGLGACTEPEAYVDDLRTYIFDNDDVPNDYSCVSSLRPQPLMRTAGTDGLGASSFEELERADILQRHTVRLTQEDGAVEASTVSSPWDERTRSENWQVTWEGVLPGSRRTDGLLSAADNPGQLDTGGLQLCSTGVQQGDLVEIQSSPATGSGAPQRCEQFERPPTEPRWRTWRIAQVSPRQVTLETIDEPQDQDRFANAVPDRECFPTGVEYRIRAGERWTVIGGETGYVSDSRLALGACVPKPGSDNRRQGRVETGGLYVGPYLDFGLYEGPVEPIRGIDEEFQFVFATQSNFSADRYGYILDTDNPPPALPGEVMFVPDAVRGPRLIVSDAANNLLYVRSLRLPREEGTTYLR
jgi:hypothetical protein